VERVVIGLGEVAELETGGRLDAAGPQLTAVETVAIVVRHRRGGVADLGPRGARLRGGGRRSFARTTGAASDARHRLADGSGRGVAPDPDRECLLLGGGKCGQRVIADAGRDVERDTTP